MGLGNDGTRERQLAEARGPSGTVVHTFVAGAGGNIFYTTDNGGTWSPITNISGVASFNGMSCQPRNTIFRSWWHQRHHHG